VAGQGARTGSIALARPVSGSHVTSAPSSRTPADAVSNRTGIPVRIRLIARPVSTPITESCGPVIPTSVSAAVPPGRIRASAVWTCVCVPSTAVARPSSHAARATFSLVASACTSTTTTGVVARASSTSSSTISHMLCAGSRKSEPSRLTTATKVPCRPSTTVSPRPGAETWKFAGRTIFGDEARYGPISSRLQAWLPRVSASAPAASSRSARRGVIPTPFATFSPLTMHASTSSRSRRPGSRASTASRPGRPTTSPTKRIRTRRA